MIDKPIVPMFKTESAFTRAVIDPVKKLYGKNIWGWKVNDRFTRGIPDFCFCFYGFFVAVELKNGQTRKRPHETLQRYNAECIRASNGYSFVARDLSELFEGMEIIKSDIEVRINKKLS